MNHNPTLRHEYKGEFTEVHFDLLHECDSLTSNLFPCISYNLRQLLRNNEIPECSSSKNVTKITDLFHENFPEITDTAQCSDLVSASGTCRFVVPKGSR